MDRHFGNYILHERVGIGGMGEVFRATKQGPDSFEVQVALKIILPHLADEDSFRDRFTREANLAASLRHPNIVHVSGFDIFDKTPFIEMEYVPGADLRKILRSLDNGEKLPLEESIAILYSVARGLAHAHRQENSGRGGVVHCDLNPHNILISTLGEVKITDFGIARVMQSDVAASATVRGKLAYMSPEQMEGRELDRRTDLFSFGIVAYQLLSGKHPFDRGSEGATITALGKAEHVPLREAAPEVPPALHDLVDQLLNLEPASRPENAASPLRILEPMVSPPAFNSLACRVEALSPGPASLTDTFKRGSTTSVTIRGTRLPRPWRYLALAATLAALVTAGIFAATGQESDRAGKPVVVTPDPSPAASGPSEPAPPPVHRDLTVASEPPGAQIIADGSYIGDTPVVISSDILASTQHFEARLYGHSSESFQAPSGEAERYTVTLAPLPSGIVRISARPWARVSFRGEDKGETPVVIEKVPVGNHTFTLRYGPLNIKKDVIASIREGINTVTVDMKER